MTRVKRTDTAVILKQHKKAFITIRDRVRHRLDTIFNHQLVQIARGSFYGITIQLTFDKNKTAVLNNAPAGVSVVPAGLPY